MSSNSSSPAPRQSPRRTKIVCTIGPASRSPEVLEQLIRAGMDVARLNFSHGTQAGHLEVITAIRGLAERAGRPVAILQDLAGLKIRVGGFASGAVALEAGAPFTLTRRPVPGSQGEVTVDYPRLTEELRPGDTVLLSDGDLALEVIDIAGEDVHCRVITGGTLASRKGLSFPSRSITGPTFTGKDRDDLAFGIRHGVDSVALSFLRTAADVLAVRRLLEDQGSGVPLIAKIETREALEQIDAIIEAADGIMVARGDLGVAIPLITVPGVQAMLIEKANRAGKPVITATDMLRSMRDNPRPARAEVSDVANAVLEGTDAVMLSEETAVGRFPVPALTTMAAIAVEAESRFPFADWMRRFETGVPLPDAVARAACSLAGDIAAAAIITCTQSGETARRVARYRPRTPIIAATPHADVQRRLALVWGVTPLLCRTAPAMDAMIEGAVAAASAAACVEPGDVVVITAGTAGGQGTTDLIKVAVA